MKICLPCPGLEHVQRGFETYTRELFDALKDHGDVHLVKSSGKRASRVHVVPALRRTSRFFGVLPKRWRTEHRRVQVECWTFALGMVPLLAREKFDVIHFSEAQLGDALKWLRRCLGFKYRLLLSNGAPWPPWDCARFDAVHQVSPAHDAAGRKFGLPENASFLVPYGTDGTRLRAPGFGGREQARRQFGLPENKFTVLSLAALNRYHKRVDWLIQEFAKVEGDTFLVLAGNRELETPGLEELAAKLLPTRNYRFLQLPYPEVPAMLHAADVLVQCSLDEGFGRVLTEAMGAGVPLLAHPHETARWIVNNPDCLVDMTKEGQLAASLGRLAGDSGLAASLRRQNLGSFQRFEWQTLVPEYLQMYRQVCGLSLH